MASQRVSTNSIVETVSGRATRPIYATSQLKPAPGSVHKNAPAQIQLLDIDFQVFTFSLTAVAGSFTNVVWPSSGFPGLVSDGAQYYTNGTTAGGPAVNTTVPKYFNGPINVSSNAQLFLDCAVQSFFPSTNYLIGQVSFQTFATNTQTGGIFKGPWFPGGCTYTSFSCIPSTMVYCVNAASFVALSVGISAKLYSSYV